MTQQPGRLPPALWNLLRDPSNQTLLSLASCWEIAIKYSKGKLVLPHPLSEFIAESLTATACQIFPVSFEHVLRVADLPHHHGDPFDRLLIVQSIVEGIPLVTADSRLASMTSS